MVGLANADGFFKPVVLVDVVGRIKPEVDADPVNDGRDVTEPADEADVVTELSMPSSEPNDDFVAFFGRPNST